jgi:hypothetical protein
MTELAHYFEIITVGLLIFYGFSPLIMATSAELRDDPHFCPPLAAALRLPEKSSGIGALLVAAMIAGFVSNQAIDAFTHDDKVGPRQQYDSMYGCWLASASVQNPPRPATLKIAEFDIAKTNDYARAYFERHKAAIRIMRAAAVAAILFILSMLTYELLRPHRQWGERRYKMAYFLIAILIAAACALVYRSETDDYYKRVFELATRTDAHQFRCAPKEAKMTRGIRVSPIGHRPMART